MRSAAAIRNLCTRKRPIYSLFLQLTNSRQYSRTRARLADGLGQAWIVSSGALRCLIKIYLSNRRALHSLLQRALTSMEQPQACGVIKNVFRGWKESRRHKRLQNYPPQQRKLLPFQADILHLQAKPRASTTIERRKPSLLLIISIKQKKLSLLFCAKF